MRVSNRLTLCAMGLVLLAGASAYAGGGHYPRQYYGSWNHYSSGSSSYYYRPYYYKPTSDYYGYKHHYVIYSPQHYGNYYYYYNPYKKTYWGRCPCDCNGQEQYSLLQVSDRKETLDQIPQDAFPAAGAMPPIPDSDGKDGAKMDLPPDDLPGGAIPKVRSGVPVEGGRRGGRPTPPPPDGP